MITQLSIANFKPFLHLDINLSNLNILTGLNGMGKSSLIQALLLLRQSFSDGVLTQGLRINGDLVELGTANDIFNKLTLADSSLDVEINNNLCWKFRRSTGNFLPILPNTNTNIQDFALFNTNFQYIGTERLAPKEYHEKDDYTVTIAKQISKVKGQCEYAIHFLSHFAAIEVIEPLRHPQAVDNRLISQTNAWMSEISPGVRIDLEEQINSVKLNFKFDNGADYTDPIKPQNTGFGISYALPLVVATLSAVPNGLLLFENPEAHIHPAGQASLAKLFAIAAQAGVQLFIETHSDHIINGTLVSMKKFLNGNTGINPLNARIFYFSRNPENAYQVDCMPVQLTQSGKIANPPSGFFDQFSKDFKYLLSPVNG